MASVPCAAIVAATTAERDRQRRRNGYGAERDALARRQVQWQCREILDILTIRLAEREPHVHFAIRAAKFLQLVAAHRGRDRGRDIAGGQT